MKQCPRVHMKAVIVDGAWLYLGSANFTGAGLGMKGDDKRNFELGFVTEDFELLDRVQAMFDGLWRGQPCASCKLRELCPDPGGYVSAPRRRPAQRPRPPDAERRRRYGIGYGLSVVCPFLMATLKRTMRAACFFFSAASFCLSFCANPSSVSPSKPSLVCLRAATYSSNVRFK